MNITTIDLDSNVTQQTYRNTFIAEGRAFALIDLFM